NVQGNTVSPVSRIRSTITELIFVPAEVKDGLYLLNLQLSPLPLDAVPSRPVLYQLNEIA
ncbi:MAG: hypothetical protein AAFP70_20315, partial [Calditrichota bacterium]